MIALSILVGVLLTAVGSFILGRWWESRLTQELRLEVGSLQAQVDRLRQENAELRRELSERPMSDPELTPVRHLTEGAPGLLPAVTAEVTLDADVPDGVDPGDLTRKISLDSAEHVMALSQQVDVLTEDVSRLHRELAVSKARIQQLEDENAERLKRNTELERQVEQLRAELRRREDKLRVLMAEVGVQLSEDDISVAMESLTTKTRKVDISELEPTKHRGGS